MTFCQVLPSLVPPAVIFIVLLIGSLLWMRIQRPVTDEEALFDALLEAHQQVDVLLAMVMKLDKTFLPSKTTLWPAIEQRHELLQRLKGI